MNEWDRIGTDADASLTDDQLYGPNLAIDAVCHESDLHEALGLPPRVDREHWQPFLDVTMRYLGTQLRDSPALRIEDDRGAPVDLRHRTSGDAAAGRRL